MANEERFDKIDETLEQHGKTLAKHSEVLAKHSEILDRIESTQAEHGDILGFIVKRIEESAAEVKRHIDLVFENYRNDMRAQGEGIKQNRIRLEEHDGRLSDLEAS